MSLLSAALGCDSLGRLGPACSVRTPSLRPLPRQEVIHWRALALEALGANLSALCCVRAPFLGCTSALLAALGANVSALCCVGRLLLGSQWPCLHR